MKHTCPESDPGPEDITSQAACVACNPGFDRDDLIRFLKAAERAPRESLPLTDFTRGWDAALSHVALHLTR